MTSPTRTILSSSGGKDSVLALYHVRERRPDLAVVGQLTCLSEAYDRVSMHGVRRGLIESQAEALGLPVEFVRVPSPTRPADPSTPGTAFPSNDVYREAMLAALARLKASGIEAVVFGDLYLEDLRAYRDGLLAEAGLRGEYPLWGRDVRDLYAEMLTLGYRAVTVCVDVERLSEGHCGRALDAEFLASLPAGADPCGERGEYHSFVHDGPTFRRPVRFTLGAIHRQAPFVFRDLLGETS